MFCEKKPHDFHNCLVEHKRKAGSKWQPYSVLSEMTEKHIRQLWMLLFLDDLFIFKYS